MYIFLIHYKSKMSFDFENMRTNEIVFEYVNTKITKMKTSQQNFNYHRLCIFEQTPTFSFIFLTSRKPYFENMFLFFKNLEWIIPKPKSWKQWIVWKKVTTHWRCRGLNPGPFTCKANALPLRYIPLIEIKQQISLLKQHFVHIECVNPENFYEWHITITFLVMQKQML